MARKSKAPDLPDFRVETVLRLVPDLPRNRHGNLQQQQVKVPEVQGRWSLKAFQ